MKKDNKIKLFGTDGIRGKAGEFPIDRITMQKLGYALINIITENQASEPTVIIGYDTRKSSKDIFKWISEGVCGNGGKVLDAGVISTPILSFLSNFFNKYSIAITASHNPYEDNGIKIIGINGLKIISDIEEIIEEKLLDKKILKINDKKLFIENFHNEAVRIYYEELIKKSFNLNLNRMNLAIDVANGAAYEIIPKILGDFGANIEIHNNKPNGKNINERCGALYPEYLRDLIKGKQIDLGISFDGDADRAIFIDNEGRIYDGDLSLAIIAEYLKNKRELKKDTIVATIMSNYGLEKFLLNRGMRLIRVPVGDKYVIEKMIQEDLNLGGEQSGHIIFSDLLKTGDGLITSLLIIKILDEISLPISSLIKDYEKFPQILINVRIKEKTPLENIPEFQEKYNEILKELKGKGRLIVRYSGTEPVLRIMIEGNNLKEIKEYGNHLAEIAKKYLK